MTSGRMPGKPHARKRRAKGWWRNAEIAALLLSNRPRVEVADILSITVARVGALRWELRRDVGLPMDRVAVAKRVAKAKTGQPLGTRTTASWILTARQRDRRAPRGRRLTDDEVVRLRERRAAGESVDALAVETGLPASTVSALATGVSRRGAGGPISKAASSHTRDKMSRVVMDTILSLREQGKSLKQIAQDTGISAPTISKVINGKVARARWRKP